MRSFLSLMSAGLMVLLLSACHVHKGWVKFSSPADGFAIYMPDQPVKTVKQEQTAFGKQAVHYFEWKSPTFDINKLKLLRVTYSDVPRRAGADSNSRNTTLDSAVAIHKRDITELDIPDERITIDGYPARAVIFQDEKENATVIIKECLANNRIYTLTAIIKKDYPTNEELNTFFNSFQVLRN